MYGRDIGSSLTELVREINCHKSFDFVKLMYLYPDEVPQSLIDLYSHTNITPYFDLPIQSFADSVLKHMGRRGTSQDILDLIKKIRKAVPGIVLRTTIMVGFPGETETDFEETLSLVKQVRFDHLGAFLFCPEEGTPAFRFKDPVPEDVKKDRYNRLMKAQKKISYELNKARIGTLEKVLITDEDPKTFSYRGVSNLYAPDDIDGTMRIYSKIPLVPGDLVSVKIVNALFYDVDAEVETILRHQD